MATPRSVVDVTIRSRLFPPLTMSIPDPRDVAPDSVPPGGAIAFLQPSVEVRSPLGNFRHAPYGEADSNLFPLVAIGIAVIAALAVYGAARLVRGRG